MILFNLSGHGHFDMAAYDAYLQGRLEDFELPEDEIDRALRAIEIAAQARGGARLTVDERLICPACGGPVPDGARFCPSCGRPVSVGGAEERKLATVLFADLAGSTELAGRLDAERMRALLERSTTSCRWPPARSAGLSRSSSAMPSWRSSAFPWPMRTIRSERCGPRSPCAREWRRSPAGTRSTWCCGSASPPVSWSPAPAPAGTSWSPASRSTWPLACSRRPSPARSCSASGRSAPSSTWCGRWLPARWPSRAAAGRCWPTRSRASPRPPSTGGAARRARSSAARASCR